MRAQGVDKSGANVCGEWFAVAHGIAGVGIDHLEGRRLMTCLLQVGFDEADVLHEQGASLCAEWLFGERGFRA